MVIYGGTATGRNRSNILALFHEKRTANPIRRHKKMRTKGRKKTQSIYGKIDENSSKDEMIAVIQHILIKENDATATAYFELATCTLVKS